MRALSTQARELTRNSSSPFSSPCFFALFAITDLDELDPELDNPGEKCHESKDENNLLE